MQTVRFTGAASARKTVAVRGYGSLARGATTRVDDEMAEKLLATGDFEAVKSHPVTPAPLVRPEPAAPLQITGRDAPVSAPKGEGRD